MCEFVASEMLINASVQSNRWWNNLTPKTRYHPAINALLNPESGYDNITVQSVDLIIAHFRKETHRAPIAITAYGCAHPTSKYDRHHAVVMLYADYVGTEAGALLVDRDDTRLWQGIHDAYRVVNLRRFIPHIFTAQHDALSHYQQNINWKTDPLLDRPRGPFVKTIITPSPVYSLTSSHREHYRTVIAQCLNNPCLEG